MALTDVTWSVINTQDTLNVSLQNYASSATNKVSKLCFCYVKCDLLCCHIAQNPLRVTKIKDGDSGDHLEHRNWLEIELRR